jgi:multidrug resistance efflux pump
MTRIFALSVTVIAAAMVALAAGQSHQNESEEPDSFDIEPPLLKGNLSDEPSAETPVPDGEVARLEKQLEGAKRNTARAERLCKIGVLSKMEVEQRFLKVIRCESDLANARLADAKEQVAAQESQVGAGEDAKEELEAAKIALAQLTEAAQIAAAKRERAELDFAEANLRRQQKLLRLGSAQKSDVTRAEQKLAELKAQKELIR